MRKTYKAGKGKLEEQEVGVGLVAADFFESAGSRAVAALSGLRDGVACFAGVRHFSLLQKKRWRKKRGKGGGRVGVR